MAATFVEKVIARRQEDFDQAWDSFGATIHKESTEYSRVFAV